MSSCPSITVALSNIQKCLRDGVQLNSEQSQILLREELSPEVQCAALAGLLMRERLSDDEVVSVNALASRHPDIVNLFPKGWFNKLHTTKDSDSPCCWHHAIQALLHNDRLGRECLSEIVRKISLNQDLRFASAWLMSICMRGLQGSDVSGLTRLMAQSGETFDYRDEKALRGARLVRRYPTGALSEKVALILPALIACARQDVSVCTPFLVARSLGYTGGTWDKLSAVVGFSFPAPGSESIDVLLSCGVAMTVTKGAANPADRILYQLRSLTGTIESIPLIVASIASKQICFPVHKLMIDVRYGNGAFMAELRDAERLGKELQSVLCAHDIPTFFTLTDTEQPTGSAIGNALEVAEAIAVMGGRSSTLWNRTSLGIQRQLAVGFFARLMNSEFPEKSEAEWAAYADNQFTSGAVLKSFEKVLLAHKVPRQEVTDLLNDPIHALGIVKNPVDIVARSTGTLVGIEQRQLGTIVNSNLRAARSNVEGNFDARVGAVITRRLGDQVIEGSVLCRVFAEKEAAELLVEELGDCFIVGRKGGPGGTC